MALDRPPLNPQPVTGTVAATQSGTWNINNISGTISLPTGAATEATLATLLSTAAFQARINILGQKVMASSTPVVLASDQSAIPVTGTFFQATQPVSAVDLDIRNLVFATDKVDASGSTVAATQSGTWSVVGTKTNNTAAPGADNFGVLPAIATAIAPSYTEGNLVGLSTDLAGAIRITGSISATSAATATIARPEYAEGASEALSQNLSGELRITDRQFEDLLNLMKVQTSVLRALQLQWAETTGIHVDPVKFLENPLI
jgi:hypothetical protein